MKTKPSKPTFFATLAGFAFSAAIATTGVSAAEDEIILHDGIDDYTSGLGGSYSDTSTRYRTGNYAVDIVLDEAYHDYRRDEVVAASKRPGEMEQAEFAAFEEEAPFDVPWELRVVD